LGTGKKRCSWGASKKERSGARCGKKTRNLSRVLTKRKGGERKKRAKAPRRLSEGGEIRGGEELSYAPSKSKDKEKSGETPESVQGGYGQRSYGLEKKKK